MVKNSHKPPIIPTSIEVLIHPHFSWDASPRPHVPPSPGKSQLPRLALQTAVAAKHHGPGPALNLKRIEKGKKELR